MRFSDNWKDYELLDSSCGEKLERWGDYILIRPDPQVIWKTPKNHPLWKKADARYVRSSTGGGYWDVFKKLPDAWQIGYNDLKFNVKTMGFKHTGIFPEQAVNWDLLTSVIKNADRKVKVLNLFAYTGGATIASLAAGADVVHVDASKGMVLWAKENAVASGVQDKFVRWIVDDCIKFAKREIRRGNTYDIIIMDPPSYGRGPNGEVWKLENEIYEFVELCMGLLSPDPLMMLINSYTTGISTAVMKYILDGLTENLGGVTRCDEIGIRVSGTDKILPCGGSAIWTKK